MAKSAVNTTGLALVAEVLDNETVVLNKGRVDGVVEGQRYLVFAFSNEVLDPVTKESLGVLEVVRGTGVVVHLQDRMATVRSDMHSPAKRVKRVKDEPTAGLFGGLLGRTIEEEEAPMQRRPFRNLHVGDYAKRI